MGRYQEASNDYDMLRGCVNRIFVTDDINELPRLYASAVYHLGDIYKYGMERLRKRDETTAVTDSPADMRVLIRMLDLTLELLKN